MSLLDEQSESDVYEASIQRIIFESEAESGQLVMLTLSPIVETVLQNEGAGKENPSEERFNGTTKVSHLTSSAMACSFGLQNCRSVCNKSVILKGYIIDRNFDIFAIKHGFARLILMKS